MAPRMNAAAPPSRPTKAAPSPTTATKTAALPPAQETKSAAWWARRLFRVGSLVFAAYFMYPRLFPSNEMVVSREVLGEGGYEPIVVDVEKRAAILDAFKHSYHAYERDAFGFDNYHPISHHGSNMSPAGGVGYFVIDSLDSLLIMGLTDEFERARTWVEKLSFDIDDKFHNFEITIRVLGGLLAAHHLSDNDPMLLAKAIDLADRLMPVFNTPSGIPHSFINLHSRTAIPDMDNRGLASVAEAGTLQLEFKYLAELSGDVKYWNSVEKVMAVMHEQPSMDGLVPIFINPQNGKFINSEVRLGSRGDSYYEYLIKQFLQTNQTEAVYKGMHDEAMAGIKQHLLKFSPTRGLMYTSELHPRVDYVKKTSTFVDVPKQDHLVCFLGGGMMLGVTGGRGPVPPTYSAFTEIETDDFFAGRSLIKTCVDTYSATKTGLAPEIVMFHRDPKVARSQGREWYINSRKSTYPRPPLDARNVLRPETVESLFIAYRLTGDPIYRQWGWEIFQAFDKHCRLPDGGFASIYDVDQVPVEHEDRMETFWVAETLKYLYLLFSEDTLIPLDKYVFSTEAHPLPVFTPTVVNTSS